jgi:hypothetical protein
MTKELLSRFVAAIVLAFLLGLGMHQFEVAKLSLLQTMSAQEVVAYERRLADHGYMHAVIMLSMLGLFYMFLLETCAYVLRLGWRTPDPR